MGTTKVLTLMAVASLVVLGILVAYSIEAEAHPKKDKHTTKVINLGILQTAAHDFYNFDRCGDDPDCAFEKEDGKLNLSTVLYEPKPEPGVDCTFEDAIDEENEECEMYPDDIIARGGEPRNSENILIFTAASHIGEKYLELEEKYGPEKAYEKILKKYHKQIKKAFKQTFHQKFPKPIEGEVNNNHNLALRSLHDMLPPTIMKEGDPNPVSVFQFPPEKLTKKEQKQPSETLNGEIDIAFRPIIFCPPGGTICIPVIDLLERDVSFGEIFTESSFVDFMTQTSDGRFDADEDVTKKIIEQFGMGINLDEDDDYEDDDD